MKYIYIVVVFLVFIQTRIDDQTNVKEEFNQEMVQYSLGDQVFEGFVSYKNSDQNKNPIVLIIHE